MMNKTETRTQNRDPNVRGDQTGSVKHMETDAVKKHGDPMSTDSMQGREKKKSDEQKPK